MYLEQVRAFLHADGKLIAVGLALALAILAFDLYVPLGVAAGVPYVVLVLLCLWARQPGCTYLMAAIGTVLTVVGFFLSPEGGIHWVVLTNRSLAIFAIWAVALFSAKRLTEIKRRKSAEAKRLTLEKRLSELLGLTADAIISVDGKGRIELFNTGAENIFGYEADEMLGQPLDILLPEASRQVHRLYIEKFAERFVDKRPMGLGLELRGVRKDGSDFPAMASISKNELDGKFIYTAVLHDISDRKEAQEQLQHAQKLEAIGQLTGGVAHDFNNLLAVIQGNLMLLTEDLKAGNDVGADGHMELLGDALKASKRGADLTQRLLAFSRKQVLQPRKLDLNELVTGMGNMLGRTLGETIDLKIYLEKGDCWIIIDPSQMENVLLNLVLNARDAMDDGGRLTIETEYVHLDDAYAAANPGASAGDYIMLTVSDTGTGMTQEVINKVFDPFFTTKGVGKGSGLGLSMVHGFVKQSGGYVAVCSEPGEGTSLKLYLPRLLAEEDIAEALAVTSPVSGQETIMVVEDDEYVRRMTVRILTRLGYRIIEAGSGKTALEYIENEGFIDLLLTDVVLPGGMNGPQIAKAVRKIKPGVKILFMSGYTENAVVHHGRVDEGVHLISKPFLPHDLAAKVHDVLQLVD